MEVQVFSRAPSYRFGSAEDFAPSAFGSSRQYQGLRPLDPRAGDGDLLRVACGDGFVVVESADRLYQNMKSNDQIAVINPKTNEVVAEWSTFPATAPHGLAIDSETGHLFSAGHNDQLVEIDTKTGKVIAHAQIAAGSDQISFDPLRHIVYCAAKGFISAVQETETGLDVISRTSSHAGSHTIAVDSSKGDVWVSFGDAQTSSLQKFLP
jgi:DNA-binding beta-propeller fold protein YncE